MTQFYHQPKNTVDVLFLGSSHAGYNVDLEVFWSRYGMSVFSLWSGSQRFELSYYYLKEAIREQNPELVILEMYGARYPSIKEVFYTGNVREQTVSAITQMKMNSIRMETIKNIVPRKERMWFVLGLPNYHQRYSSLQERDFQFFPWNQERVNQKGNGYLFDDFVCETGNRGIDGDDLEPLSPDTELYLRKIIELTAENNVQLLLVNAPMCRWYEWAPKYREAGRIADEYGVPFLDMNYFKDDIGMTSVDYEQSNHLVSFGARKVGIWLADYVAEHYDLPDHRGDPDYASWDVFAWNQRRAYLPPNPTLEQILEDLRYGNRAVFIAKNGYQEGADFDAFLEALSAEDMGLDMDALRSEEYGVWMTEDFGGTPFANQYEGGLSADIRYADKSFFFDFLNEFNISSEGTMWVNRGGSGLAFLVYDRDYDDMLYAVKFEAELGYRPVAVSLR